MEDQAAGMGPHRLGFPERSSEVRVLSVDQLAGIVDRSPSELRSSEVSVERLDQETGRVPPRDGDLRCTTSEMCEMNPSNQWVKWHVTPAAHTANHRMDTLLTTAAHTANHRMDTSLHQGDASHGWLGCGNML